MKTKRNNQAPFIKSRHPGASRGPGHLNQLNKMEPGFRPPGGSPLRNGIRDDQRKPPSPYSEFIRHGLRPNPSSPGKSTFAVDQEWKNISQRLQRILAQSGLTSRRKAEDLIRAGRVKVDGRVVTELGLKLIPSDHRIEVDGQPISSSESKAYYLFYKPQGVISTLRDPQGRPTIQDFLSQAQIRERVFPVGRLDWDAEGLMLLTNDGDLSQTLQHPKFQVPKTYRVKVQGIPTLDALRRLQAGTWLPSGKKHQAEWEMVKTGLDRSWLLITIREGEKHQVKNICAAIGHPVMTIKRIALGPLTLGRLAPGAMRPLTPQEIQNLTKPGLNP